MGGDCRLVTNGADKWMRRGIFRIHHTILPFRLFFPFFLLHFVRPTPCERKKKKGEMMTSHSVRRFFVYLMSSPVCPPPLTLTQVLHLCERGTQVHGHGNSASATRRNWRRKRIVEKRWGRQIIIKGGKRQERNFFFLFFLKKKAFRRDPLTSLS